MLGMISLEISMFMRWVEVNCNRMLNPDDVEDIAKRILTREKYKFGGDEITALTLLAMGNTDFKRVDSLREKFNFDKNVSGFCASIGISVPK